MDIWQRLGVAPTRDEMAIRRAYARRLKDFRPDEDPEGFQALVAARERALALAAAPEEEEDEAPVELSDALVLAEDESAPQPPPFRLDEVPPAPTAAEPPPAYPAAVAALRALFRDADVFERGQDWRDLGRRVAALTLPQRALFRPQVAGAVVANLPPPPDRAEIAAAFLQGRGPAIAVDWVEQEFELSLDQAGLARQVGAPATLRYLDWLDAARRAYPFERLSEPERQFRLALALCFGDETATDFRLDGTERARVQSLAALFDRLDPAAARRERGLIVERLGARLPTKVSADLAEFEAGRGVAAVVAAVEAKWSFQGSPEARSLGEEGGKRYAAWSEAANGLAAIVARRARGEAAYRDASGIPSPPPEDRRYTFWGDPRFAAYWVKARETGRWPLAFDAAAFFLPARRLATAAAPGLATAMVAFQCQLVAGLWTLADAGQWLWVGVAIAAVLLLSRCATAFCLPRVAIWGAMRRVRGADAAGVVGSTARAKRIVLGAWGARYARLLGLIDMALLIASIGGAIALADIPISSGDFVRQGRRFEASDVAKAMWNFNHALELDANNADAWAAMGKAQLGQQRYDEAKASLDHALALDPKNRFAWFDRARLHAEQNEQQQAVEAYGKAIELYSGDAASLNNRGVALEALGRKEDAKADYTRAIEIDAHLAIAYRNRGRVLYDQNDYEGALADFKRAVAFDGGDAWAAALEGDALVKLKRDDDALAAYDEALKRDPKYVSALRNRAAVLRRLKRYGEQLSDLRKASAYAPDDARIAPELAEALADVGDYEAAERIYDDLLRSNSDLRTLSKRGQARLYLGKFAEAAADLDAAFEAEPWPYSYLWSDVAARRAGREPPPLDEARAERWKAAGWPGPVLDFLRGKLDEPGLLAAASGSPDHICEAHFYIGELRRLKGEDARPEWTLAAETCPDTFIEARAAKAELARP